MQILPKFMQQMFTKNPVPEPEPEPRTTGPRYTSAFYFLRRSENIRRDPEFYAEIAPIYQLMLNELKTKTPFEYADESVALAMYDTANALRYRWASRLPRRRPGTDYRKYEFIYTDALVTVMAVDRFRKAFGDLERDPANLVKLAEIIIPPVVLNKLKADPMVWKDWLGFFEQSEIGGLYYFADIAYKKREKAEAEARGEQNKITEEVVVVTQDPGAISDPAPEGEPVAEIEPWRYQARDIADPKRGKASGWEIVDGIRRCLQDGSLSYNELDSLVQVDKQGRTFLRTPEVFDALREIRKLDTETRTLTNQFSRLKIVKRGGSGNDNFGGNSRAKDKLVDGYVIESTAIFWDGEPPAGRFNISGVTQML